MNKKYFHSIFIQQEIQVLKSMLSLFVEINSNHHDNHFRNLLIFLMMQQYFSKNVQDFFDLNLKTKFCFKFFK